MRTHLQDVPLELLERLLLDPTGHDAVEAEKSQNRP